MKLAAQHRQHVHASVGFALEQDVDVAAIDLDADTFLQRRGVGLVRGLLEHGSEAEELAVRRFVDDYFLMIVVYGGDADLAGNHDVGTAIPIADFVDALARGEFLDFYLAGQDAEFVVVEERKQRYGAKRFWTGSHRGTSSGEWWKHSTSSRRWANGSQICLKLGWMRPSLLRFFEGTVLQGESSVRVFGVACFVSPGD